MRDYAKISCSIWNSRKFRSLNDDDAKLLYFYLHTCRHVNSVGCFILPPGYAVTDLGWSEQRFRQALDRLSTASLTGWDEAENLVRIVDYLKQDPLTNPSHAAGVVSVALKLPITVETSFVFRELLASKHVKDRGGLIEALDSLSTACPDPNPQPPPPNPTPEPKEGGGGSARGAENPNFRERILAAIGLGPDGVAGPSKFVGGQGDMAEANRWLTLPGITEDIAVSEVSAQMAAKRDGPPSRFSYFTPGIQRLSAQLSAPPLIPSPQSNPRGPRDARVSERRAFDSSINQIADGIAAGTVDTNDPRLDPFAARGGR